MSPPNRTDVRFQDEIGGGLELNETLAAAAASLPHLAIATAFSSAPALKLVHMLVNVAHRSESRRGVNRTRRAVLQCRYNSRQRAGDVSLLLQQRAL